MARARNIANSVLDYRGVCMIPTLTIHGDDPGPNQQLNPEEEE